MLGNQHAGAHTHRYMGQSLAAAIVTSDPADPQAFRMVVGVGDSVSFNYGVPSWDVPPSLEDRCYVGALHGLSAPVTEPPWAYFAVIVHVMHCCLSCCAVTSGMSS
jgi:hypothetical protein